MAGGTILTGDPAHHRAIPSERIRFESTIYRNSRYAPEAAPALRLEGHREQRRESNTTRVLARCSKRLTTSGGGRVSGRRVYPRFRQTPPAQGQFRVSRDVVVQRDDTSSDITVLSDAPVGVAEQMTLSLVSSTGEVELQVTVVHCKPHIVDGTVRYLMQLAVGAAPRVADEESTNEGLRI